MKDLLVKSEISEFSNVTAICEKQLAECRRGPTNQYPRMLRIRCCYNSKRRVMKMSSSFLQFQGTSEYFPQYASQSGEVLGVLKQFLVEMNINIAAAEATEFEHKKTFDELSDTKIEEIAASNQQHKEKSLKEQETKLSNDRNTTELKRTQESVGDQEAFLANLGQLDICEIQKIAETIETLHENEDHARDHFSKTKQTGIVPSTDMQGVPTSWKR